VSNEACALHDTGWNHPDHQGRLPALTRAVYRDLPALFEPLLQLEAPPATADDLLAVHTRAYLDDLRGTSVAAAAERRTLELGGVPVSGASWDAALGSVGATLAAVDLVLGGEVRNAFVPARPPGRGARADGPGEHSLVNQVAVAARRLREARGSARVLVVAWGGTPASALRELLAGQAGVTVI
jgi:acetoin utilization deacetylase AcuC-like enzyme